MQTRLAFQGALLGLWFCLFAVSFCYSNGKTVEVAGEQVVLDKAFSGEIYIYMCVIIY